MAAETPAAARTQAAAKRLAELLFAQRDKLAAYLDSLDKQRCAILGGSAEDIVRYTELEEKIAEEIFAIQKTVDPFENLSAGDGLAGLMETVESLKAEAALRSERNRGLLSARMAELRQAIMRAQSASAAMRRFENAAPPTRIDIKA